MFSHLLSVSASTSLRLIQKYWLLLLIIVSISHLSQFLFVISNMFIYTRQKKTFFIAFIFFYYILLNFIASCFSSPFSLTKFYFILSYLFVSFKMEINSLWLIFMSFNAYDINFSILLYLLLVSIRIWSFFFFFFIVVLCNFLMIPAVIEKIKLKHGLVIPAGTPIVLTN